MTAARTRRGTGRSIGQERPSLLRGRGVAAAVLVVIGGEDAVQRPSRVGQNLAGLLHLSGRAGLADLGGGHQDLADQLAELHLAVVDAAGHRVPGRGQLVGVRLGVGPALIGQGERLAAAVGGLGLDQPLILELLERGVDRTRAGPPHPVGALADLLDDLVPVAGTLGQQRQRCGPDVTPAYPRPAAEPRPHRAAEPAGAEPAGTTAATATATRAPAPGTRETPALGTLGENLRRRRARPAALLALAVTAVTVVTVVAVPAAPFFLRHFLSPSSMSSLAPDRRRSPPLERPSRYPRYCLARSKIYRRSSFDKSDGEKGGAAGAGVEAGSAA